MNEINTYDEVISCKCGFDDVSFPHDCVKKSNDTYKQRIELWGVAQISGSISTLLNQWESLSKDDVRVELKDIYIAIGLYGNQLLKSGN